MTDDLGGAVDAATAALVAAVRAEQHADLREDVEDELAGDERYLTSLFRHRDALFLSLGGIDLVSRRNSDYVFAPLTICVHNEPGRLIYSEDPIELMVEVLREDFAEDVDRMELAARVARATAALQEGIDRIKAAWDGLQENSQ